MLDHDVSILRVVRAGPAPAPRRRDLMPGRAPRAALLEPLEERLLLASFTVYDSNMALRGDNFQSHNQKIVWTANGIFRSGDLQSWPNGSDNVVVQRSTDGGVSWQNVFDTGIHRDNLKPPTVEADPSGNVYVVYPDSGKTRFLKFSSSNNYASPVVNKTHSQATSASKFASAYDPGRDRIYHATQWGYLFTFDTSGNFVSGRQMFSTGSTGSRPSYPHLFVDEFGVIHYALTVADDGDDIPYETIRYLKSLDGGSTWRTIGGQTVSLPTTSDPGGPSTMINGSSEVSDNTWLANMHAKDGKVHFAFENRTDGQMRYVRFDEATGTREIDRTSLAGSSYSIRSEGVSFASDTSNSTGVLYVVGEQPDGHRLVALASYDNGQTWQDYARSNYYGTINAPGLARSVTPNGEVIGGVALDQPYWATVNHVEFPTAQPTTTAAYWDGGGSWSNWNTSGNWVGDVTPGFNDKLAVVIGSGSTTAKLDTMRIENNLTVRALVFGTYTDADVNLRLHDSWSNGRTLTFASNVPAGSAEINVHHDATADIDIGAGVAVGNVVLGDPLRVNHNGSGMLTISRPISGNHTISKYGDGEFQLTGNNSGFTGALNIREGKLALAGLDSENGEPDVQVASGATLSLGSGFIGGTATVGNLTGAGKIDPQFNSGSGTRTLQVNQTTDGPFSGTLQDATTGGRVLALVKNGSGTLRLDNINTYTGGTTVNAGTLELSNDVSWNDCPIRGQLTVNSGGTVLITGRNWVGFGNGGAGSVSTLNVAGGTVTNTRANSGINGVAVNFTGGLMTGGAYMWISSTLNSKASATAATFASDVRVRKDWGSTDLSIDVEDGAAATDLSITGIISEGGVAAVTKTGPGVLAISAANTYTGGTTTDRGTFNVSGNQSAATGGWTIGKGNAAAGAVNFQAGSTVAVATGKTIQVGSIPGDTYTSTAAQTLNVAGSVSNDGTLAIGRRATVNVNDGATWTQNGNMSIDGIGGYPAWLNVNAGGILSYAGGNSIKINPGAEGGTGGLTIGGTVVTGQGFERTASGGAAEVWLDGGTLRLSGDVADLTFNSGAMPFTFAVGASGGTIDTAGRTAGVSGIISGTGALTKSGGGTLTLTGANTYSGTTTVSAGTLRVDGDQSASTGAVTVAGGATLGGSGAVGGAVTVQAGGALSPGNSVGTLALESDLAIDGGAQLSFELGTTGADLVTVDGSLDLSEGWVLKIVDAGDRSGSPGLYELFTCGSLGSLSQPTFNLDETGDLGWTADMLTVIDGADGSVYLRVVAPPALGDVASADGVTATAATLHGELADTGGEDPQIMVFWGDNAAGLNPQAWDHSADLGTRAVGTFSHAVAGLDADTQYYFTFRAVNSAGAGWLDPAAGFTTAEGLPAIEALDSSEVSGDARIRFTTDLSRFRPGAADSALVRPAYPDARQYVDLTNTGSGPLSLCEIRVNAPDVTVDPTLGPGADDDLVLQPGESQRVRLTYKPTLPSFDDATCRDFEIADALVVISDAANTPALGVTLEGHSTFDSDINHDGQVNLEELGLLNVNFGRTSTDADFDPTADIDGDGMVNLSDLGPLNKQFGLTRPAASEQPAPSGPTPSGAAPSPGPPGLPAPAEESPNDPPAAAVFVASTLSSARLTSPTAAAPTDTAVDTTAAAPDQTTVQAHPAVEPPVVHTPTTPAPPADADPPDDAFGEARLGPGGLGEADVLDVDLLWYDL